MGPFRIANRSKACINHVKQLQYLTDDVIYQSRGYNPHRGHHGTCLAGSVGNLLFSITVTYSLQLLKTILNLNAHFRNASFILVLPWLERRAIARSSVCNRHWCQDTSRRHSGSSPLTCHDK